MTGDRLRPDQTVRLLRAKTAELEQWFVRLGDLDIRPPVYEIVADVALVADILASFIEDTTAGQTLYEAHTENLIERVAVLEAVNGDGPLHETLTDWLARNGYAEEQRGYGHVAADDLAEALILAGWVKKAPSLGVVPDGD